MLIGIRLVFQVFLCDAVRAFDCHSEMGLVLYLTYRFHSLCLITTPIFICFTGDGTKTGVCDVGCCPQYYVPVGIHLTARDEMLVIRSLIMHLNSW